MPTPSISYYPKVKRCAWCWNTRKWCTYGERARARQSWQLAFTRQPTQTRVLIKSMSSSRFKLPFARPSSITMRVFLETPICEIRTKVFRLCIYSYLFFLISHIYIYNLTVALLFSFRPIRNLDPGSPCSLFSRPSSQLLICIFSAGILHPFLASSTAIGLGLPDTPPLGVFLGGWFHFCAYVSK